ncbi:flagellar biosynthetic protein FliR [Pseudobacteriovorax antillogorgiicola]|uniref:Flagellar biosynthetic protein FliR n=1 Tax=Pseudobacteriovorax antillogorgiicola TaxID=1513793 RepID=A0A1Y6CII5_9BACT|nr:flagellar biosynthetic protein FliR [Pseudobacteriovorax antillogorgiicola]TCS46658.1 flagellar biosynthetic protein FliR [Pseudobacteriovorax antillogorgiicola]SMF66494.1 flagellar biosynthetic protein FliR [Pseudobacteriovorax antillogorgiicola]
MFNIPYDDAVKGGLIFLRVSGIVFTLPIFGDEPTPVRVRILFSVAIAFLLYPVIMPEWYRGMPQDAWAFAVMSARELIIGLMLGFVARLVFDGIVMAASIVGYQMGFGTANLMIPDANIQMNSFTATHRILLMLIFLSLNLHHLYISAIADSFRLIPSGFASLDGGIGELMVQATASVFVISVQLSAPVLVALMFTMAALGLIARTVPQMNIFTMSFPTSFFIGLLIYIASLPYFPQLIKTFIAQSNNEIKAVLRGLAP